MKSNIVGIRKPGNASVFLDNEETVAYLKEIKAPHTYKCRVCGGLITFSDNQFYKCTSAQKIPNYPFGALRASTKKCFLGLKEYNGHLYRLSVCEECVKKQFPGDPLSFTGHASLVCKWMYNVSEEDYKAHTQKVCVRTEESFIKKYGEEEGLRRWKHYCDLQAETNTFEYKSQKYGMTEEEFKQYNLSRAVTLDNLIRKHGEEEGRRIFEEYREKQRNTTSLEYFIETYGEEEGQKKYDNWNEIRKEQCLIISQGVHSIIADEFFQKLSDRFIGNEIYTHVLNHEWTVGFYSLDYYDKTLNVVVEFYGDYWHYNPAIYEDASLLDEKFYRNNRFENRSDVWKHDKTRQKYITTFLKMKPENFIIVWENDYRNDRSGTITKVERMIRKEMPNDSSLLYYINKEKYEQTTLF